MIRTAILVDGGYYRKRAAYLWGKKAPHERASELYAYCRDHIKEQFGEEESRTLYRVFYYDCPPIKKNVFHPLTKRNVDFGKSETYQWACDFFDKLKEKRKFALRLGTLSDERASFILEPKKLKALLNGKITIDDLAETDFSINFEQKGVDMKIGLDISTLSYKRLVDQIVLISGDSDFVSAAKMARREGVDFILDPMRAPIKSDLFEHIDGKRSPWKDARHPRDTGYVEVEEPDPSRTVSNT